MSLARHSTPHRTVRVKAPGKINVSFRVGPPRADGYHHVASVYLAVSLFEEVAATATDTPGITLSIKNLLPDSTQRGSTLAGEIPLDERNLAYKAAALMAEVSENATGVHLEITKRVPVAGGMGGGSADAAATLLACDALWDSGLSREELAHLAAELGADVPFALLGGAAVGTGVGDQLSPALATGELTWVLVQADFGLSTPEVFRQLDELREQQGITAPEPGQVEPDILAALRSGDAQALAAVVSNDLQEAAVALAPELNRVLEIGRTSGALAAVVSGSGPTVAMLAVDEEHGDKLIELLEQLGLNAIAVTGPVHGAKIS